MLLFLSMLHCCFSFFRISVKSGEFLNLMLAFIFIVLILLSVLDLFSQISFTCVCLLKPF